MMLIKDMKERMKVDQPLLIQQVTKGITNNGAPYLSMVMQDKSGTIDAKYWDVPRNLADTLQNGQIVHVQADVLRYKQQLQLRVLALSEPQTPVQAEDFMHVSIYTQEQLHEGIQLYLGKITNDTLHTLVSAALEDAGESFYAYPAAARNHHDFYGGLATHVLGMCKMADAMCDVYPALDRSLLLSGVIVHDIGKINEYTRPILPEYSTQGKLLGHISIMNARLYELACALHLEDKEETLLLRHMILSHHGQYEYGSPVLPMIREAEMLNFIDNIDARMNMFDKLLEPMDAGSFSPRIFSLENRSFYKPVFDDEHKDKTDH